VQVLAQFGGLLLDKALGGVVPPRFIAFALVGALCVFVNLAAMVALRHAGFGFGPAQALGTVAAMVFNFQLNNQITYRDQRLRGRRLWTGLALFMAVCGLGGVANVGIATTLNHGAIGYKPAGAVGAAVAGRAEPSSARARTPVPAQRRTADRVHSLASIDSLPGRPQRTGTAPFRSP
jgi:dolichol-phosphate mannosyltransferase